jgi:hypothetical protein
MGEDGLSTEEERLEKRMSCRHKFLEQPHEASSGKTTMSLQKLIPHQHGV